MKTAIPTAMRLSLEDGREERMLKLMSKTRLKAPFIASQFVSAVLDALPDGEDTITFPIEVEIKGHRSKKALAA